MPIVLLRAVDLETSGLAPPECVIEIGWSDVYWDIDERIAEIMAPQSVLFAPTRPITPENRAVHHIADADFDGYSACTDEALEDILCKDEPFALVAAHAAFEQQWLVPGLTNDAQWICTVKAAARLFPDAESHSNQAIRYRLCPDLPEALAMPPHRAGPDAYVTANILAAMLETTTVGLLVKWTNQPKFLPRCPLGKWKGRARPEVEHSYLEWILQTGDMDSDIQFAARQEIDRRMGEGA